MANTVAGLAVSLGLNATEYYKGLSKAEYEAKKFSQSFSSGMSTLKAGVGALGIGLVVNEIYQLGKAVVSNAADLADFAAQTGSSVEALSKLANQAQITGIPFQELQTAAFKLAEGMGGAGKKSAEIQQIFKTLGVTAKDPAQAMQEIAVALAKYEDGATKAAYANILFGNSGAKFLATLKDMANLQDVVGTTTTKQAEEAKKLEQAYNSLGAEATKFKNIVLDHVVPALTAVIAEMTEGIRIAGGFGQALLNFGTINPLNTLRENLEDTDKRIKNILAGGGSAEARWAQVLGTSDKLLAQLKQRREFLLFQERQTAMAGAGALGDLGDQASRAAARFQRKQQLPEPPTAAGAARRAARTPADRISDAERYLASLEQQLQKTQELTAVETILADVEAGRFKVANQAQMARALNIGEQIDAAKALEKAEKERQKIAADEARTREQVARIKQRGIEDLNAETAALAQGNEQLRLEIEAIGLDATSMAQLTARRLEDAAAAKEQTAAMYRNAGGMEAEAAALEDQARLLRERKGILAQKGVAEQMAADVQKAKEINDLFVESFAEGARSIAQNATSIGDAVKRMGQRITDALLDIATKNIATSLFGAASSSGGGGIFASIGPMITSALGFTGFAAGGMPPMGRISVVGERGPEFFIPKTAGTIVPMNKAESMLRGNYVFNINVPAGATRSTIDQTRVKFGLELQNALDRGS